MMIRRRFTIVYLSIVFFAAGVAPRLARAQAPVVPPPSAAAAVPAPPPPAPLPAPSDRVPPPMPGAQEAARAPTRRQVPQRLDHRHQTGLSLMPGIGFEIRVPYQDNKDCGDPDRAAKRVCTGGTPLFLDLQLAFGISSRIDLMADLRFGLDTPAEVKVGKQFAFAPGVRVWLDQDSNLKFYTTGQFVYDSTTQNQINVSDQDYGVRNANGLMYDVIRNVGFFFQFGETIGFKRWFRISLDAGLGVQVRFP